MSLESRTIPKYYHIGREIAELIRAGQLQPIMKAPPENELIQKQGVSNTTARKALQQIEAAGWFHRKMIS